MALEQLLLGADPTRAMFLAALADSAAYLADIVQQAGTSPTGARIPIVNEDPEQSSGSPIRGLTAADRKRSVAGALCLTEGLALMANRCWFQCRVTTPTAVAQGQMLSLSGPGRVWVALSDMVSTQPKVWKIALT